MSDKEKPLIRDEDKQAAQQVIKKVGKFFKSFFGAEDEVAAAHTANSNITEAHQNATVASDLPIQAESLQQIEEEPIEVPVIPPLQSWESLLESFQQDYEQRQLRRMQLSDFVQLRELPDDEARREKLQHWIDQAALRELQQEDETLVLESESAAAILDEEPEEEAQRDYRQDNGEWQCPSVELLAPVPEAEEEDEGWLEECYAKIQDTLDSFRIDAVVHAHVMGPRIVRFHIKPAPGIKLTEFTKLSDNLRMVLKTASIRVLTPVPGLAFVGIEAPRANPETVTLRKIMDGDEWQNGMQIPLALGVDMSGAIVSMDLAKAPHLLIAGATGAGKSVCVNAIIISLLQKFSPAELELIMVDPKVVELSVYGDLPHLLLPVVTDTSKVPGILQWAAHEMKRRYKMLELAGCRNIQTYNSRPVEQNEAIEFQGKPLPGRLPFTVIIIDELADIMVQHKNDVEGLLAQIAQLSRAVGMHTIVATQRPSVDVLTGIIKANYPSRIAFRVTSMIDSRVILDRNGAEALLGSGDMLLKAPNSGVIERVQGCWVSDQEIEQVVNFVTEKHKAEFDDQVLSYVDKAASAKDKSAETQTETGEGDDDLLRQATELVRRDRKPTTSYIQRRLKIGYNRAADLMEKLEDAGVVGPLLHNGKREILID